MKKIVKVKLLGRWPGIPVYFYYFGDRYGFLLAFLGVMALENVVESRVKFFSNTTTEESYI